MAEKETEKTKLNAYIHKHLAEEFRQVARLSYGQIGLCLSAAMLKFLETAPAEQVSLIRRVYEAEADGTMDELLAAAKANRPQSNPSARKKNPG